MKIAFLMVVVCLLASSCGQAHVEPSSAAPSPAPTATSAQVRSMAITVTTSLRASDVPAAVAAVRGAAVRIGGYVSDGHVTGDGEGRASLEVKVPAGDLATFRAELAKIGDVVSDAEHVEDVSDPIADLDARLSTARVHEKRLLELLANRTGNLADVVALENQIAHVREGIEQMEAQRRGLGARVALATVHVEIEPRAIATAQHSGSSIATAAVNGVRFAWSFVIGSIVVIVSVAPTAGVLAALAGVLYVVVRRLSRLSRRPVGS